MWRRALREDTGSAALEFIAGAVEMECRQRFGETFQVRPKGEVDHVPEARPSLCQTVGILTSKAVNAPRR